MLLLAGTLVACGKGNDSSPADVPAPSYSLSLAMSRNAGPGLGSFTVTATLNRDGSPHPGQTLALSIPAGAVSGVTDHGNGTYSFTVTPAATGTYSVTVSYGEATVTRKAVVLDTVLAGAGQPMAVPGDYVNTEGYEDGVTITPDGEYLFVQYGPIHFSGLFQHASICASAGYSVGYDLNTCAGRPDASLVFDTIGPYAAPYRPNFPSANIADGTLLHLDDLIMPTLANGLVGFPTAFYGFKRQSDGTFAEPFKVAFNDERGINGPFGLSFRINGDGTATFALAWNNYFNDLGDDKPDIYHGTLTLGAETSLGDVMYGANDTFLSINPLITPVGFSSHVGVQGNPHIYLDGAGNITSIWTDDEQVTNDLSVYRLTAGSFPTGTWVNETLPSVINTAADEDQPFFTGNKLYFSRGLSIVYHDYTPTNGACGATYTHNDCWGPEVIVLGANANTGIGEIFAVGEPTIASYGGKTYLYFVYVERRENVDVSVNDYDLDAAFVELP